MSKLEQHAVDEQGYSKTQSKFGKVNKVLGPAFIGVDTVMRVKDGESVPVALGKAVLTNAAWSLVPGGVVGGLAVMGGMAAVQMAPAIAQAMNQKEANMGKKGMVFGGASNFVGSEGQQNMMMQGLAQADQALSASTQALSGHARAAHKMY